MFDKGTIHTAAAIVLGLVAFTFIKRFLNIGDTKQVDGSEYIPGQARM
jgi:hypothetical protein